MLSRVVEVLQRRVIEFPVAMAGHAYRGLRGKVATALGIIKHRAWPSDCRGRLGAGSVVARNLVVGRFAVIIGIKRRVVKHLVRRPGRTAVAGRCRGRWAQARAASGAVGRNRRAATKKRAPSSMP